MREKLQHTVVIVAACVIITSGCSDSPDSESDVATDTAAVSDSANDPANDAVTDTASNAGSSSACFPPQDDVGLKDQDMSDHQVPWERNGADKVPIYFEAGTVSQEYRGYLDQGAAAWNRSPCLDARIVDSCPDDVNCVTVSLTEGDDADGNFDSIEERDFTIGGHIDLYFEELDDLGDGAKLNVTIHEMGHAVGLRHRQTERVLMNGDTYTDIFDPDEIDLYNLLVLYGNQS